VRLLMIDDYLPSQRQFRQQIVRLTEESIHGDVGCMKRVGIKAAYMFISAS
jgi:hypothetical protein